MTVLASALLVTDSPELAEAVADEVVPARRPAAARRHSRALAG